LRVKGIVAFADRGDQPALVQAAQHTMFAPEWLDAWPDATVAAGWSLSSTTFRAAKSSRISPLRRRL
jgi:G3E family GTPase